MTPTCAICRATIDPRYPRSLHVCGVEPLWGSTDEVPLFEVSTWYCGPGLYHTAVYRLAYGKRGNAERMLISRDGLIREEKYSATHEEAEHKHKQIIAEVRRGTNG